MKSLRVPYAFLILEGVGWPSKLTKKGEFRKENRDASDSELGVLGAAMAFLLFVLVNFGARRPAQGEEAGI